MAYHGVCWKDKSWHTLVYHGKVIHGIPWCMVGRKCMAYPGVSWEGNSKPTMVYHGKVTQGIPWCIMER